MSSECQGLAKRRTRRRQGGFTLIEVIMAVIIIGVGLAGVLSVFNVNVRNSADPVVRKQLLAIAEEMLEEIALRPYTGPSKQSDPGCVRTTFDDVSDYHLYPANGRVCNIEGVAIASLSAYSVAVTVTDTTLDAVPAKRITVVASRGGETLTLSTWRTGYAQ